ncbi:MAG: Hsp70 family protein [Kofleriaceae bacterium]|jgi:molecular chaperone DnaK|nr:Hsp70 family protein [Kofleriaceae bacterium]MBP9168140.1 Hsp70 family protein [Kofleriaceae bacterium]MBP9856482.1 Hsp70 family protein [Kofleriaceae bacterium]
MALAVGIDLGTTNSVVAVATPTGVEFALGAAGERIHPSVVSFPPDGGIAIGVDAKNLRADYPTTTIYSAKRLIGQNVRSPLVQLALTGLPFTVEEGANQQPIVVVGERRLTVPEVSAHVLGHLKQCAQRQLGQAVSDAVITVPANFTDAQRQATKEAGRLAGLNVLRLLNEPTAAALAYGFGQHKDETVCVFDFGGGTFDVSLLAVKDEVFEVLATDGDFFLGGDDVDRAIAEFLAAEVNRQLRLDPRRDPGLMARLTMAAEQIKIHLSEVAVAEGTIDGLTYEGRALALPFRLTRVQLEDLIRGYVDRTIELTRNVLTTANLPPQAITEVVCVGGSTRIPLVRRRLAELFGREPALRINPDEVVAQGAAIQAGSLSGHLFRGGGMSTRDAVPTAALSPLAHGGVPWAAAAPPARPILLDVTPASLRISTAGGFSEAILEKNLPTPIERTRVFTTAHDHQTRVVIECGRGEARRFADNEPLGTLILEDLPPRRRGEVRIEVTFRVDTDGILMVRARDADTGIAREAALTILGAPTREAA